MSHGQIAWYEWFTSHVGPNQQHYLIYNGYTMGIPWLTQQYHKFFTVIHSIKGILIYSGHLYRCLLQWIDDHQQNMAVESIFWPWHSHRLQRLLHGDSTKPRAATRPVVAANRLALERTTRLLTVCWWWLFALNTCLLLGVPVPTINFGGPIKGWIL